MRYFKRSWIGMVGLVCAVGASAAMAQQNEPSSPPPPNATNLGGPDATHTTSQQAAAPVVDPQTAVQDAAQGKPPAATAGGTQNNSVQNQNQNTTGSGQQFPAPARYGSSNTTGSQGAGGRASLGANVVSSNDGQGVIVSRIRPGTPAAQMGLQPRDRIVSLNGQPVVAVDEFIAAIRGMNIGDEVQLSIDRGGETRNVGGRLEALREAIATGDGPVRNLAERTRSMLARDRDERVSVDAGPVGVNVQAGYEDGGSGRRGSADVDARISRLEQQIERLTREIEQLRTGANPGSATGPSGGVGSQPTTR